MTYPINFEEMVKIREICQNIIDDIDDVKPFKAEHHEIEDMMSDITLRMNEIKFKVHCVRQINNEFNKEIKNEFFSN